VILVLSFSIPSAAPVGCPKYTANLVVLYVNAAPNDGAVGTVGTVVNITVRVAYPDGTPAVLSPAKMSFLWIGNSSCLVFQNVTVLPTRELGVYQYNQTITCISNQTATTTGLQTSYSFASATTSCNQTGCFPSGLVRIYVMECGCADAVGNYGPIGNMGSDETLTLDDNSIIQIGATTSIPSGSTGAYSAYMVPILIIILAAVAVLLAVARLRKRGK